jgi:hypothetical protein
MGTRTRDTVKGRAVYVLILIVGLNLIYPMTSGGSLLALIIYEVLYAGLFVVGIVITSDSRSHITLSIGIAVLWLIFAVLYAFDPLSLWKSMVTYVILVVFHAMLTLVLFRYIFTSTEVTTDVLFGAVAAYFLLSFLFVPIYGMLETYSPGSFVDHGTGNPVHWQELVYYSLITLSTAGFGDVTPINPWARMLAGLEATVGVMYVAILMARLVSMYEARHRRES